MMFLGFNAQFDVGCGDGGVRQALRHGRRITWEGPAKNSQPLPQAQERWSDASMVGCSKPITINNDRAARIRDGRYELMKRLLLPECKSSRVDRIYRTVCPV